MQRVVSVHGLPKSPQYLQHHQASFLDTGSQAFQRNVFSPERNHRHSGRWRLSLLASQTRTLVPALETEDVDVGTNLGILSSSSLVVIIVIFVGTKATERIFLSLYTGVAATSIVLYILSSFGENYIQGMRYFHPKRPPEFIFRGKSTRCLCHPH